MFIWDFVADKILGQIVDWFYSQVVGFLGNFFSEMGSMGAELFEMNWVQSVVLFFSYLGWALFATGLVVAVFECGIEYSAGRGNVKETALNVLKGFLAVSLFTQVPVRLYSLAISLQGTLTAGITGFGSTSIGDAAKAALADLENLESLTESTYPLRGFGRETSGLILCFLYDTAARVQEICDLRIEDVRLDYPASVKILGKGRKTRVVPILPATAQNLKKYLTEMHMLAPEKSHLPLFMNRNGQKLTRAGVTYILNKYAKAASVIDPSIPEKIPPHLMRHTKAMHIYDADNDLVHVRDFLGHSDIKTTDIYARSSLTMKQKALERVSDSPVPSMPSWQKSRSTMEWLKSFGSQKA